MISFCTAFGVWLVGAATPAAASKPPPPPLTQTALVALIGPGTSPAPAASEASGASAQAARLLVNAKAAGESVFGADELSQKLRGAPADCPPSDPMGKASVCHHYVDEPAVTAMLAESQAQQAYFQGAQADGIREQILTAYARTPQPSPRLRLLAGLAWLERANGMFEEDKMTEANAAATYAMSHFASTPIDKTRFPPLMQKMFAQAREAVFRAAQIELRVRTNESGELFADGNDLGRVQAATTTAVPLTAGKYRLWLQTDDGLVSLPAPMEVTVGMTATTAADITFDPELDRRLTFNSKTTALRCADSECIGLLTRLRDRLGVARVVGIGARPGTAGTATTPEVQALSVTADSAQWLPLSKLDIGRNDASDFLAAPGPDTEPSAQTTLASSGPPPSFWARHRWSLASAVLSAVALGTGIGFTLHANSQHAKADQLHPWQPGYNDAQSSGDRSSVTASVFYGVSGAALIAAGVRLYMEWYPCLRPSYKSNLNAEIVGR